MASIQDLIASKDYPKALQRLKEELRSSPRDPRLRLRYADVLLMAGQCRAPIVYYLRRLGLEDRFRVESYPAITGEVLGFYDGEGLLRDGAALDREARVLAERYRRHGERVLLVDDPDDTPAITEINRRLRRILDQACLRREVVVRILEEGAEVPRERVVDYRFGP